MKIGLFVICYNEVNIVRFAVQYWKRFADHVYVYDNGSTDGTLKELAKFQKWITVIHYDSDGLDDAVILKIKENCWKPYKDEYDFVVVSDFDEFLYSKDLKGRLTELRETSDATVIRPRCYEMFSETFPKYTPFKLTHETIKKGVFSEMMSKCIIFDPKRVVDMNWTPGCHKCYPNITKGILLNYPDGIYQFHHKHIGKEYAIEKKNLGQKRLSYNNKLHGWGVHYNRELSDYISWFNESIQKGIDVTQLP